MLTAEELRQEVLYDPESGHFYWRKPGTGRQLGVPCGSFHRKGYRRVKINTTEYLAHRLAWLYMTGCWPVEDIDHIDRCRGNNSFSNLREATRSQNIHWGAASKPNNYSNYRGAYRSTSSINPWFSSIAVMGKTIYLGSFKTDKDAAEAYNRAAKTYFGEFAVQQDI